MMTPATKHEEYSAISHRPDNSPPCDLHYALRHYVRLIDIVGGWPLERTSRGNHSQYRAAPWFSRRMLAYYALASVEAVFVTLCLHSSFLRLQSNREPYMERVILVLHIVYETVPLSLPVLHWQTGQGLAHFFNDWLLFQSDWMWVTGGPLRFDGKRRRRGTSAFVLLFSLLAPYYHSRVSPHLHVWKVPLYCMVVLQCIDEGTLWKALNSEVVTVSTKLRDAFHHQREEGRLTGDTVRSYCMLWLRLRHLTLSLGNVWGSVVLHTLMVMVMMSMTSCFGLLYALSLGILRRIASTMATIVFTATIISWICSESGRAASSVSREMLRELLTTPLGMYDTETAIEVVRFVQTIQYKPVCVNLKGFLVVDRRLSIAAGVTVVTYIVVLAQLALTRTALEASQEVSPH